MEQSNTAVFGQKMIAEGHTVARQWFIAALVGIVVISATNAVGGTSTPKDGDSPLFILVRLSVPVLVMAWYARRGFLFSLKAEAFPTLRHARITQIADSLYFLGFLWTLWALIDSFVIHQMSVAQAVFRTFGYALITTASGMFLRLFLIQFQNSDNDLLTFGEQDLSAEIQRFRDVLSQTTASVESFQTQTSSAVTNWVETLNQSTDSLKRSIVDVRTTTEGLRGGLGDLTPRLEVIVQASLTEFTAKIAPTLNQLNNANRRYSSEVDAASERIKATNVQFSNQLAQQLGGVEATIEEVARKIGQIRVPADAVEKLVGQYAGNIDARLGTGAKALETAIADLAKQVRATTRSVADDAKVKSGGFIAWLRSLFS